MVTFATPLPLLLLSLFVAIRLIFQLKTREPSQQQVVSLCRQVFLQGLTFLGVMTFFSVLREDGCWLWWATSFQLLAVLASVDWRRGACLPSEV